ncbi:MAG: DMT family transporter, partial [Proteobacteria bacterium]|nr:DMT family transporter [Pseudomonadota bacterium]
GLALFVLLSFLWGLPYLFIKVAVAEVSVPFIVFARSALGALVLLPFALRGAGFKAVREHWRPVLVFALVEMVVPQGLIVHGELRISSSMAGLLVAATPILTVLAARWLEGAESLGWRRGLGLGCGIAGVGVLAIPEFGGDLLAVLEVLIAAGCYAVGSLIAGRRLGHVPAIPMTTVCLATSALCYAVPAILHWPATTPSWTASLSIGTLGIACTAAAFACFFHLIREIGSERAVVITYVSPAVAVAAGVVLLDEPLTWGIAASFGLILAGSWLATGRGRTPAQESRGRPPARSAAS